MSDTKWPSAGFILLSGETLGEQLAGRNTWKIWRTREHGYALLAAEALVQTWEEQGTVEPGIFLPAADGVWVVEESEAGLISSSLFGPYPQTAFWAQKLLDTYICTRTLQGVNLNRTESLFVSRLPVLLSVPSRKGTAFPARDDAWVLGRWLSGGMNFPVTDVKRMRQYVPFLSESALQEYLESLGWEQTQPQHLTVEEPPADIAVSFQNGSRRNRKKEPFALPGRQDLERFFREQILDVIDREEEYRRMGIGFPGPTLLIGPTGCGKTYAVEKLMEHLGWPVFTITSGSVGSSYLHETSKRISEVFSQAMGDAPSCVIMDELEAFLSNRDGHHAAGYAHLEEMAEFLRLIPQLPSHKVLLFGMTNMPDVLDPAILRKGRFDHILTMGFPSDEELTDLLGTLLQDVPTQADLNFTPVLSRLRHRPISDVFYVAKETGRLAVVQGKPRISTELLLEACRSLPQDGSAAAKHRRIGF